MTQPSGDAQQLHQELWISFTALLRAYAAAASLALPGGRMEIKDRENGGLEICTVSKKLQLSFDGQSGTGRWSASPAEETSIASSGAFQIDEHGRVKLDDPAPGSTLEMDAAAEAILSRIL